MACFGLNFIFNFYLYGKCIHHLLDYWGNLHFPHSVFVGFLWLLKQTPVVYIPKQPSCWERNVFVVTQELNVCLTLANDQLDAQILLKYIYYNPLHVHVSSKILLILRRSNCTNTTFGIFTLSKWPSGAQHSCTPDGHLLTVTIPDVVLIQFDLLRMSKILLETCTCRGF